MYVELLVFRDGEFIKREDPFFTKKAFQVFDKVVAMNNVPGKEVIVAIRNDNHTLVRCWGNIKEPPKYKVVLKKAKAPEKKIYSS